MKKRLAGVLAALMVLVMGTTTVFAAGSPSADDAVVEALNAAVGKITTQTSSGTVEISKKAVEKDVYQDAEGEKTKANDTIIAMTDIQSSVTGTVTVKIPIEGVKPSDNIYVLHRYKLGARYVWEALTVQSGKVTVGSGYITVTMDSFSPIFVVKEGASTDNGGTNGGSGSGSNTGSGSGSSTTPPTNGNNNNNTTGDSTSQSNNNNQSNSQTNNQNNPVNVDQTVNVTYPEMNDRYDEGYEDGYNAAQSTNKGSNGSGSSGSSGGAATTVVSPKTGASLPALPFVAMFAAAGIAVCGKKARKSNQ